jgi:hypothetical protein
MKTGNEFFGNKSKKDESKKSVGNNKADLDEAESGV